MAWKKMQLKNYLKHGGVLRHGNGINDVGVMYVSPYYSYRTSDELRNWVELDFKLYNEIQRNPDAYGGDYLVGMWTRRIRSVIHADYFTTIYALRQKKWAEKHDVDIENDS